MSMMTRSTKTNETPTLYTYLLELYVCFGIILDRTANIDGSEYRCLNHSIFGEGGNSTNNNICYYSASNTSYHCESYTSHEYSFHTKGGFYLSSNTPFDVAPVSVEKAKIEVRSPRDSIVVESGKCSRID